MKRYLAFQFSCCHNGQLNVMNKYLVYLKMYSLSGQRDNHRHKLVNLNGFEFDLFSTVFFSNLLTDQIVTAAGFCIEEREFEFEFENKNVDKVVGYQYQ